MEHFFFHHFKFYHALYFTHKLLLARIEQRLLVRVLWYAGVSYQGMGLLYEIQTIGCWRVLFTDQMQNYMGLDEREPLQ
jgi:hypothetical protein